MEKKTIILLVAALAIIAIAAAVFLRPEEKPQSPLSSPQAVLLFSYLEKMGNTSDCSLSYEETKTNDIKQEIELVSKNESRFMSTKTLVDEKKVYKANGDYFVCEKLAGGEEHCALLKNSSILISYAYGIDGQFLDAQSAAKKRKNNELLISKGVLSFSGGVDEKEINGIPCSFINYSIDYGKLSISDLNELGLSPADPVISVFSNYTVSICINNDTGIPVETALSYVYAGKQLLFKRTLLSSSLPSKQEINVPSNLTDESTVEYYYDTANGYISDVTKCIRDADRDGCYLTMAITNGLSGVCDEIKNDTKRDRCLIALVHNEADVALCEKVTTLKDDCFAEAAVKFGNKDLCANVTNETLREQCISAIEGNPAIEGNSTIEENSTTEGK